MTWTTRLKLRNDMHIHTIISAWLSLPHESNSERVRIADRETLQRKDCIEDGSERTDDSLDRFHESRMHSEEPYKI